MSVKIKISWDNENVVSESVRIYRADSTFASTSLPPLLTEITGDVYEYEDFNIIENQTYFYMLSAKLGEQEVFTECFEVKALGGFVTLDFVSASTSPSRYSLPASAWPLTVPPHNAGDIVIVFKSGADTELASYGFVSVDVSDLTDNYIHPWYKIATSNQISNLQINLTNTADKAVVILRPSRPITSVEFEVGCNSTAFTGNGDSPNLKSFLTPTVDMLNKGYFLQFFSTGSSISGSGKAQTITVNSPATLIASPKTPVSYNYASSYANPPNPDIKAFSKAIFGQKVDVGTPQVGGYNSAVNYFTSGTNRFLNLQIAAK